MRWPFGWRVGCWGTRESEEAGVAGMPLGVTCRPACSRLRRRGTLGGVDHGTLQGRSGIRPGLDRHRDRLFSEFTSAIMESHDEDVACTDSGPPPLHRAAGPDVDLPAPLCTGPLRSSSTRPVPPPPPYLRGPDAGER